eukprot:3859520-Rhodomonas_salina.1
MAEPMRLIEGGAYEATLMPDRVHRASQAQRREREGPCRREGGRKRAVSYTHLRAHETEADL